MIRSAKARRGIILLLVLVVIAMLGLAGLGFSELMLNERRAALTSGRQAQARAFAQSGAQVAMQFLDRDPTDQTNAGGIYDNPSRFADQLVADEPLAQDRGRFSVVAPQLDADGVTVDGARYGLQDESTRINLATILTLGQSGGASSKSTAANDQQSAAKTMLMALPGMTDDISDSILDWIDADDTPRQNGAESDYYSTLTPPYSPRNGPPVTIEELLLVKGVTPELLFGLDAAKMGLSSGTDSTNGSIAGVDNSDGSMDHGWAAYFTLWSAESNMKSDGTQKINLNGSDMNALYNSLVQALDEPSAEFIVAYRIGATAPANGSKHLDTTKLSQLKGSTKVTTLLDLVGARATLTSNQSSGGPPGQQGRSTPPVTVKNPFTADSGSMSTYLPKLFDNCTTTSNPSIPGRININQASKTVLMCIPNMTSDLADQIVSQRVSDPTQATDTDLCPAWPLIKGMVPLGTMKALLPFVNAGGSVYRAQVLGTFDKGSTSARIELVIDATKNPSQVLFWKDISRLPGGFPVEPSGQGNSASK